MDAISPVTGVGAVANAAFQVQYAVAVADKAQEVATDLGSQALKLIAAARIDPATGHDLDVVA